MKNFIPLIILTLVLGFSGVMVYNSSTKSEFSKQKLQLSEFKLVDLYDENKNLTLSDFRNNKNRYTIVNFFASWCVTCLAEHELLFKLSDNDSFDFFGIAWHDFSKNTLDYLKENGDPYDRVFLDGKNELGKIIALKAVPETVIINPEGSIIMRHQGNLDMAVLYEMLNFIERR